MVFSLACKFEIILAYARQLHDSDKVVTLLEDIDRGERPSARGRVLEPIAGSPSFQLSLQAKERVEGIRKSCDHGLPPVLLTIEWVKIKRQRRDTLR